MYVKTSVCLSHNLKTTIIMKNYCNKRFVVQQTHLLTAMAYFIALYVLAFFLETKYLHFKPALDTNTTHIFTLSIKLKS